MLHCANCGAPLAPDAQFCSRCGHAVAAAPPPPVPPPAARLRPGTTRWWIIPLIIVGVVVIAWLVMAGLPFGRDEERRVAERPPAETIGEATVPASPPQSSGTIVDVAPDTAEPPTVTVPPPVIVQEAPPPATQTIPPFRPAPAPEPVAREINEEQATAVLRGYVTSRRYYDGVRPECVQIRGSGYRNEGYAFSVWDGCVAGGGSRLLGRWRVDSKTQEVFRQRDDGRYVPP